MKKVLNLDDLDFVIHCNTTNLRVERGWSSPVTVSNNIEMEADCSNIKKYNTLVCHLKKQCMNITHSFGDGQRGLDSAPQVTLLLFLLWELKKIAG